VYKEEFGIELPSFTEQYYINDTPRIEELINQYKEGWVPVQEPKCGDLILFRIFGSASHVGILVDETKFIHSRGGYDVAIAELNSTRWQHRVLGYFRYDSNTEQKLNELPAALQTKVVTVSAETLDEAYTDLSNQFNIQHTNSVVLLLNNHIVPKEYWSITKLQPNDIVSYRLVAQDDQMLRMALVFAVVIAAPYVANFLAGGSIGIAAGTAGAAITGATAALATAAVSTVGMLLVNAIFPVRPPGGPQDPGSAEGQIMINGIANRATPYQPIPVILGTVRITPPLAAENYITYPEERNSYLTTAVVWGFGPLQITNQKIGDVSINNYTIQNQATLNGYDDTFAGIALFNNIYARDVEQDVVNVLLVCDGPAEPTVTGGEVIGYHQVEHYDSETGNLWTSNDYERPILSPTTTVFGTPGPWVFASSTDTATELTVAFHMPQGMRKIATSNGSSSSHTVYIETQYKHDPNSNVWIPWEKFTISGDKKDAYTITRTKTFSTPQLVQIQVRRLSGDNTDDDPNYRFMHDVIFLSATYTSNRFPIKLPKDCTLARSAYSIKAEGQLSNQLEGINGLVSSRCKPIGTFDAGGKIIINSTPGTTFSQVTNNPASLFFHVLTHPANPQRILDNEITEKIDITGLQNWYNYCEFDPQSSTVRTITYNRADSNNTQVTKTYKYAYNGVISSTQSILDTLRDICAAGRASPALIDGKWTVVIDEPKPIIVQHFTPHNSWGFEGVRSLAKEPDGLKVTFYDEEQNYQQVETIVYNTGKSYQNAELFESITLPGITNEAIVIDHAKWHLAQAKLRREVYTLNADLEYLVCNRGDRVKVTHDVPAWGLASGRVKDFYIVDTKYSLVELTENVPISNNKSYTIRFRGKTGQSTVSQIKTTFAFIGFTRQNNIVTINLTPNITGGTIPFDETNIISISSINYLAITANSISVTINRTNNTISYPNVGINETVTNAIGTITLQSGMYRFVHLQNPIEAQSSVPGLRDSTLLDYDNLFMFGELNKESQDLLVISIEPSTNKTAKITLMDYGITDSYNIFTDYKNLSSNSVFETQVSLPPTALINSFNTGQTPAITQVYSDARAVDIISPGVYKYNIKISYATVDIIPTTTKYVVCEYKYATVADIDNSNSKLIYSDSTSGTITITDVIAGESYKYRLRYMTSDNIVGPWTNWATHQVSGLTINNAVVSSISVKRLTKVLRINIVVALLPKDFKYFKIKIFKDNGTGDFWSSTDSSIITINTSATYADINLLDFASPRISSSGIKYRIACRMVDSVGNESLVSALTDIFLTTISP
jgi:sulfur carrier protein ThiS